MSSKRVKREPVNLVSERSGETLECERLRKEVNHKNEVDPGKRAVTGMFLGLFERTERLMVGYYSLGGVCWEVAEGVVLWCLYRAFVSAV